MRLTVYVYTLALACISAYIGLLERGHKQGRLPHISCDSVSFVPVPGVAPLSSKPPVWGRPTFFFLIEGKDCPCTAGREAAPDHDSAISGVMWMN
ncbi:hypothetical protein cyc_03471 [Cyclospora cayetanensis]|uniref:Uncharacterized protein n=1 Tax=Cyclospora cayetanensis TaxID=88456 RepID=A0A1D3DB17_9EIME|nr:hypothetical protein cyc_03471 [Cyclospora cayetanensis]